MILSGAARVAARRMPGAVPQAATPRAGRGNDVAPWKPPDGAGLPGLLWFLIESDDVPARIAEPRRDFRRINTEGLDDSTPGRDNGLHGGLDAIHHDVEEQAGCRRRWAADNPGSAHFAGRIVECGGSVTPLANVPAKHLRIELGRFGHVRRWHFEVAD